MNNEKFALFQEDFALLIETGFIAVKQLDEMSATRLFQAAQTLSPASTAPQVGMGFIAINKLKIKEATDIFEKIVNAEPENHLAQTFLGMCFLLTKGKANKGEKLIKETMEKTTDPTIKDLGTLSLEWSSKDLSKKQKSPFFAKQKDPGEEDAEKHS
jgi:hypothetical protein